MPQYSHVARVEAELALIRVEPFVLELSRQWENVLDERVGHSRTLGFTWSEIAV